MAYNFSLQAVGLVCMAFVTWRCVTATSYGKEEEIVIPPAADGGVQGDEKGGKGDVRG